MQQLAYISWGIAVTCFISAFVLFGAVVKKDKDEFILSMSDTGTVFVFLTRACAGWNRSAFGRGLSIIGGISLITGVLLHFAAS